MSYLKDQVNGVSILIEGMNVSGNPMTAKDQQLYFDSSDNQNVTVSKENRDWPQNMYADYDNENVVLAPAPPNENCTIGPYSGRRAPIRVVDPGKASFRFKIFRAKPKPPQPDSGATVTIGEEQPERS